MITLLRAKERHYERHRKQEVWLTFYPRERGNDRADHFGPLESLTERRLPPGAIVSRTPHHDAEIVTYVREGALAYEDSPGCSGVIRAGEFQATTAGRGIRRSEANASRSNWARVFQLLLASSEPGLEPGQEQKRLTAAQRRGGLCVVASADARRGSLRIHQDALMCSALLDPGQHLVHELCPGRTAWLHLVEGEVTLGEIVLTTGDGAGVTAERAVSLTAQSEAEILLVDLGEELSRSRRQRARESGSSVSPRQLGLREDRG
jgi:redox-sensitive bicupin YhaK (pirin superfamily)